MNIPAFDDPFANLPEQDQLLTSIVTSREVAADLNACFGSRGAFRLTVNNLLKKLHNELNKHGLLSYNPPAFAAAINDCRITLGGTGGSTEPAEHSSSGKTDSGNDGRGTQRLPFVPARCGLQPTNRRSTSAGKKREVGGGK